MRLTLPLLKFQEPHIYPNQLTTKSIGFSDCSEESLPFHTSPFRSICMTFGDIKIYTICLINYLLILSIKVYNVCKIEEVP